MQHHTSDNAFSGADRREEISLAIMVRKLTSRLIKGCFSRGADSTRVLECSCFKRVSQAFLHVAGCARPTYASKRDERTRGGVSTSEGL